MPVAVGDRSAPASADQPKFLTTPNQERSARGIIKRGSRKHGQVRCCPGQGTPSAPRIALTPPTAVRGAPVGMDTFFDLGTRVKSYRVPMVHV